MNHQNETKVNILCMKWGSKYGADYVNKLYSMVARNLSKPFRFICLTDDAKGLMSHVECFPIPKISVELSGPERGWNKLAVFQESLYDITGDILCLDLDLIIVGSLDDLFEIEGSFLIIKDWVKSDLTGNSSVYRFTVGAHKEVLSVFENSFESIKKTFRNEQEYLSDMMAKKNCLKYWPVDWCRGFKRHCIRRFSFVVARDTLIPINSRVIVFHGKPDPHDALNGHSGKWYRKFKPADWVGEYWR